MRGAATLLLPVLLLAACGGSAFDASTTASPVTTATLPETTTDSEGVETTAPGGSTTTAAPPGWAGRLVGTGVWGEWEEGNQIRRLRGEAVGEDLLWLHLEYCLDPEAGCPWWLLYAARPTVPPMALEAGFDGFIALARTEPSSGSEGRTVAAVVDVVLPAGAGMTALLAGGDEGPFWAAELGFAAGGPVVRRAWRPDPAAGDLVPVDPRQEAGLPDPATGVGAGPLVGRVVTGRAYLADPGDPQRVVDLSGPVPVLLAGWREAGGWVLPGGGLAWMEAALGQPAYTVWLEQLLGWSYLGHALWRVVDSAEFGPEPGAVPGHACRHEPSVSEAVALVTRVGCGDCPVASAEAYALDLIAWRLVPVPPEEVSCTCECEG